MTSRNTRAKQENALLPIWGLVYLRPAASSNCRTGVKRPQDILKASGALFRMPITDVLPIVWSLPHNTATKQVAIILGQAVPTHIYPILGEYPYDIRKAC